MPIAVALLVILGFIWGSGYSIARFAMTNGVPPLGYAFWQSWGPVIVLTIIIIISKTRLRMSRRHWLYYLATGVFGIAIPNTNYYFTAVHLPAGILAVVINTVPIFTYPLALLMQQERFYWGRIMGVLFGIVGIMILVLPHSRFGSVDLSPWLWQALISPISFSICAVIISRFRPKDSSDLTLSAGMLFCAAIILTPIVFSLHQFYPLTLNFTTPELIILLEIVLSSIGYILLFELIKRAGPVFYSIIGGLTGLTGLFWGYIIFHEHLTWWLVAAVVFILLAIICLTLEKKAFTRYAQNASS